MKSIFSLQSLNLALAILSTLLADWCVAGEHSRADFFDIVGKSPAEVVAIIPDRGNPEFMELDVVMGGFVGLPMLSDHRKEFVDELKKSLESDPDHKPFAWRCLLNLLEEDRAFDEALAMERAMPRTGGNVASPREIALLWKAGRIDEATMLADGIKTFGDSGAWLSLVRIDVAKNQPGDAMRLLGFLESRPNFPGNLRYELAIQHLEIARRSGRAAELFEGAPLPVFHAIWHWALGQEKKALDAALAAGPDPTVSDIQALSLALGTNSPAGAFAKAALAKPGLNPEAQRVLLGCFNNPGERFTIWLEMPADQGLTTDMLDLHPSAAELEKIPDARRRVLEIVNAHPEDANLKVFAASPEFSSPDEAKQLLLEAAKSVRENPVVNGPRSPDPAKSALEMLVKSCAPAELDHALKEAPGFAKLSPEDQLRYLMAAELDQEVVKTMARCRFDQPTSGNAGLDLIDYFNRRAYSRQIPPEVVISLLKRLPELVLGPGTKRDFLHGLQIGGTLTFFSTQPVSEQMLTDAIQRLITAAGGRDPALGQTIISQLPANIRSLPGLELPAPEKPRSSANVYRPPAVLQGLSVFSPPDVTVIGRTGYTSNRMLPLASGYPRVFHDPMIVAQFAFSPWTQNYRGATSTQGEDPSVVAKLRGLFADDPSRTLVYDLLVAIGALPCPDPVVKRLVETRISDISHPLPIDPAAGVFLFLQKLSKGEPADKAANVLDGYDRYLLPVRKRVLESISWQSRFKPADLDVLRERLGFPKTSAGQAVLAGPPEPNSPYERLQFFREAGKWDSPEAIAIARDVLFKSVGSKFPETSLDENIAISTLVTTGHFEAFLTDLKSRMDEAGKSELEIQRALYRVHLYRIVHSKGEIFPFAKRILELDPMDAAVAADVLAAATAENDRPLALKAMGTLCRKSPFALAKAVAPAEKRGWGGEEPKAGPLSLFPGAEARVVAELMLGFPFKPDDSTSYRRDKGESALLPLYLFFAENDMASLPRILRWAGAFSPGNGRELTKIAEFLVNQKRSPEAIRLLADAYFSPPVPAAKGDLQFAPKPSPGEWEPSSLDVHDLRRIEILKPLAESANRYPATAETAKARVMISLAADPTPDTWDRIVQPFLAASPAGIRPNLKNQLQALIQYNLPEADALKRRLALEYQAIDRSAPTLDKLLSRIRLMAESGDSGTIDADWAAARELLKAAKPDERTRFLNLFAWPMAKVSSDSEWREFIQFVREAPGFTQSWLRESSGKITMKSVGSRRLQDLAVIVLANAEPNDENNDRISEMFHWIATSESLDTGILQKFRPWIEKGRSYPQAPAQLQFLDLLAGDASAASPQVDAVFTGESWQVSWSLAGCRYTRSGYPFVRKFQFLDGLFDLEILAGTHADRLDLVRTIPGVAATGRVMVKLPPSSRFVSLLARKRDGGIVRWANPQEIGEPVASAAIKLPETFERIPSGGPFFLDDAVRIILKPDSTVELAALPWTVGSPTPQVSGWIQGASVSHLYLSFRTAAGVEIEAKPLQSNATDPRGMPTWERFATPSDLSVPPEAETVVLVVKNNRYDTPDPLLVSGVRQTTASAPELPPGLIRRGRAPGMSGLVMDRKENRFATSSRLGIGVFDLTSGRFSGWIPIGEIADRERVEWLDIAGDHIAFGMGNGELHVLSLVDRKVRKMGRIAGFDSYRSPHTLLSISPDGRFFAWGGIMAGVHLIHIGDAGEPGHRLIETAQNHSVSFDAESKNLVAYDGTNLVTVPLADWQNSVAKVTRAPLRRDEETPDRYFGIGDSGVTDSRHGIRIRTGNNRTLAQITVNQGYATFPQGILALDRDGVPFFIDNFGRIFGIDVEKIKGYKPLAK